MVDGELEAVVPYYEGTEANWILQDAQGTLGALTTLDAVVDAFPCVAV